MPARDWSAEDFARYLETASGVIARCRGEASASAVRAARLICSVLDSGGKILVCGNGGSAADSQHFASELTGRFLRHRRAFAAVALTTDGSALTAISNDYGFDHVFARQVEALGGSNDLLVAISTSGKSPSILEAAAAMRRAGGKVVGMTGQAGGDLPPLCDICIQVPSDYTPHIQEAHGVLIHTLCQAVEAHFGVGAE